jgi:hypothetical protein
MRAQIRKVLVVYPWVFDMRDQRVFGHHRPCAIGQRRHDSVDGRAQGNEICRDHGIVADDFAVSGKHCGYASPKNRRGNGELQNPARRLAIRRRRPRPALAPEGRLLPIPAGTGSRNGKAIFLKNILRPIVTIDSWEPTTMSLAPVLNAQLK